jgi:hypothetical protein
MIAYMVEVSHAVDARATSVPEGRSASAGPGLREALVVWGIVAAYLVAILVTYSRLDPRELYNTSVGGFAGGAGRALVGLNFPLALVALCLLGVAANALLDTHRRLVAVIAACAVPLCLLTAFVVDQHDLDARLVNALPALGVAFVAMLTAVAVRRCGAPRTPAASGDPARVVLIVALAVIALPWSFAMLGLYAPDPIYADEASPGEPIAAVHRGSHHGFDGVVLAWAGLLLSRSLPSFRHQLLAKVVSPLLALAVAYGVANALQDFTLEQLWKRGTIGWKPPSVLLPSVTWGWLVVLAAAAAVELLWFRRERRLLG